MAPTAKTALKWAFRVVALVVCLYLALILISVTFMTGQWEYRKTDRACIDVANIRLALGLYAQRYGELPSNKEGLRPLKQKGMLDAVPIDPWGHEYRYAHDGQRTSVWSLGRDGVPGGLGPDGDIGMEWTAWTSPRPGDCEHREDAGGL